MKRRTALQPAKPTSRGDGRKRDGRLNPNVKFINPEKGDDLPVDEYLRRERERSKFRKSGSPKRPLEKYTFKFTTPVEGAGPYDPKVLKATHRALRTQREAMKRRLKQASMSKAERDELTAKIGTLDEIETALFEVKHKVKRAFQEYGGKPPEPAEIIRRAIVRRCLEVNKPHLILPKLAAMFPKDRGLHAELAREARLDKRVRQTIIRIRARQIVGFYEDPVERVIAENYFQSARLSRPLVSLHREVAVEELESQLDVKITVEKYRRHLRSLFLSEYR